MAFVGVADHGEQRAILPGIIHDPVGVEDLVPAMLGIGLREHHQFHIGRIALQPDEAVQQIVDFVLRQGQSQFAVGGCQRLPPAAEHIHGRQRLRFGVGKQHDGIVVRR